MANERIWDLDRISEFWGKIKSHVSSAISGKADKVSSPTNGNFAGLDANGNLTDSGKKASDFLPKLNFDVVPTQNSSNLIASGEIYTALSSKKNTQTAVSDPTASGNSLSFIDSISQDTQGVITATKKSVTVDASPTENSANPVQSGGVYSANAAQNTQIANLKSDLGVVEDTDTATHTISKDQYVIWKGVLYTAKSAIPSGTALSSSNLEAVSNGGFNALKSSFDGMYPQRFPFAKIQNLNNAITEVGLGYNTVPYFGRFQDATNAPATGGGFLIGFSYTANSESQVAMIASKKALYVREKASGTWGNWKAVEEDPYIKDVTYTVASTSVSGKTQLYAYVAVQSGYTPIGAYFVPGSGSSSVLILSNPVVSSNQAVCRIFNPNDAAATVAGKLHVLFAKNAVFES